MCIRDRPYIEAEFKDGTREKIWCTFCEEQVDLDLTKEAVRNFMKDTLKNMCLKGASVIRLDAFAYAVKKKNTSCFFVEMCIRDRGSPVKKAISKFRPN